MSSEVDPVGRLMAELSERQIEYLRFELPDLHGVSRSKTVPVDKVEGYARHGLNFYGGVLGLDTASNVVPGSRLHTERNYADQNLFPDPDSLRVLPWLEHTASVLCLGYWDGGEPQRAAPRWVFSELVKKANALGYDVMLGHEYEYYLLDAQSLDTPARGRMFEGLHIFNTVRNHWAPFLDTLVPTLRAYGIDIVTHNTEYAGSQFETVYGPGMNLAGADKAFAFKNGLKELAHRNGLIASFMAKPFAGMAGSGCHLHLSLWDRKTGRNAFMDAEAAAGFSDLAGHFIEGVLAHGAAMMPLINPTPNCYHRVKPHTFAPSNISWGVQDRSAMVRVKATGDERTHIEMRGGSAASNPYLLASAVLAAGLLGLEAKAPLREQGRETTSEDNPDLTPFPQSLPLALDALEADDDLRVILGEEFVEVFTAVKRFELARFAAHVTDWETNEYLELY
ncbi:L-glutamine synthetase [Tistlia consotensis]|uniref:Glutamine synthetase n=1 Tax=Tistlia consotensis USBA 355 TaxID=560819 RepID=A0A1Y6CCF9_9PROT|nr:glutamine synthetase family protein [Tistlia consotensis]SMF45681.1 L-glutamine synthetase [Tistlia consotensis USBA 355]SNR79488.1 L-glutamine synthetase [Tistlia consotensis]